eukprot:CAMPEP_0177650822 /NCGR_PEP_ID=MMETSP0447-20121125/12170_1 /TAXON_ID=0 /ORGANISM="Stygamoeba regulata, Strain BSH-02190019" /LENGTH=492 /DNA_ID=CAMNT_0019153763 /DNA_START=66 /DNA_END=1545 /DNA_ORIENTATION=-
MLCPPGGAPRGSPAGEEAPSAKACYFKAERPWCPELPSWSATQNRDERDLDLIAAAGSLHEFLQIQHAKHGSVVRFQWGAVPAVSLSHANFKAVQRLFDRPNSLFESFRPVIGNSLQYANKDEGKWRRKAYTDPAFSHRAIQSMVETFQACSVQWADRLSGQLESEQQVIVPIHKESIHLALRGIAITSFGHCFEEEHLLEQLHQSYNDCMDEMDGRLREGMPEPGSAREQKFKAAKALLEGTVRSIVDQVYARREQIETPAFFLEHLIKAVFEDGPSEEGLQQVVDEGITFLIGGFHTSGNLFAWALYYVARHPEMQQRIYEELCESNVDGPPSFVQLRSLKYLHQFVQETIRCSVLAPWGARESDDPIELTNDRGQFLVIPAHTPIVMALGVALRDPELWPQPDRFDPERFAPGKKQPALAYSPFGFAGRRVCPGKSYAYTNTEILLATLLSRFRLSLRKPNFDVQHHYGFVTKFKGDDDVMMVVEKRNQ